MPSSTNDVDTRNSKSIEQYLDTLLAAGLGVEAAINRTMDYAYLVVREAPPVREGGERCIYSSEYWSHAADLLRKASQSTIQQRFASHRIYGDPVRYKRMYYEGDWK